MELTEDTILNGKIKLFQPKDGYRVALDPIILASFISPMPYRKILDVGCGVGTISLILKMKESAAEITAIDMDKEMCRICAQNSAVNELAMNILNVGIEDKTLPKELLFDHVVTNPPFFRKKSSHFSESKKLANFETISLVEWISLCINKLKNSGTFSIIHRASRLEEILSTLKNRAGAVKVVPIFSKSNKEANRVVVQAKKSSKSEMKMLPGIVVHLDDGSYSESLCRMLSGNV